MTELLISKTPPTVPILTKEPSNELKKLERTLEKISFLMGGQSEEFIDLIYSKLDKNFSFAKEQILAHPERFKSAEEHEAALVLIDQCLAAIHEDQPYS